MARTYISLFSSAGVGCYGFKLEGFECVATNELLEPRIAVQKANHKCKYESGYICGDATSNETHQRIFDEIERWREQEGLRQVDVVFATPPCQGMSTANYKKTDHEQVRNSLVVQAIKIIKEIKPKVFVFENVRAFMKSICTDLSKEDMLIKESIFKNLADDYNIYWKVINFMDYGVPSSRPRTLVIGTSKQLVHVSPLQLFPTRQKEILLKDSIGGFPRLDYCEKDKNDPFHFARPFPEYMLDWIKDLKEGETAFDNPDDRKPYSIDKEGNKVVNKGAYMGNKYRRLIWDRPGACIATRSDIMSSQDTIHPTDNRVLSISELMVLMTIPRTFKWTEHDEELTVDNSDDYLKENEGNIRRCIGEAVPTQIARDIAGKVKKVLDCGEVLVTEDTDNFYLKAQYYGIFVRPQNAFNQIMNLNADISQAAFGIYSLMDFVNFAPQLMSYFSHIDKLSIDVIGLDEVEQNIAKQLAAMMPVGANATVRTDVNISEFRFYSNIIKDGRCTIPQVTFSTKKAKKLEPEEQLLLF